MENRGYSAAKPTAWQIIQTYFNLINHIMIWSVAIYMTFLCYGTGNQPISWHAWLCTIGYQLLMTQSILAFYSENVWSKHHTRNTHKFIHWVLQAVGSLGAIAGMIIEFVARYQKSKTHFQSTHSILGLTAFILTILGMLNGVFAINAVKLKKYGRPLYFKFVHNLTGIAAFVIGMTCLYYGYDKNYMKFNSRPDIRMWLQALTIITILLSLIGALRSTLNFVRSIFNN